ncbi:hypothetical protein [Ruegeria arenilitoris]|uniref:hypothetical protein n=1 Tax=Ruegeria arenilitoris TaxID=1173585 RepID=UPI00147B4E98|nr:hypothetical protein [Ruegeria arenilitoris]
MINWINCSTSSPRQPNNLKIAVADPAPATKTAEQNTERAAQGRLCSFSTARSAPTQQSPTKQKERNAQNAQDLQRATQKISAPVEI